VAHELTRLVVTGTMTVAPEDRERFAALVRRNIAQTRGTPGCIEYTFAVDVTDPNMFHNIEAWSGREALEAHMKSDVMQAAFAEVATLRVLTRDVTAYEVTGRRAL
jgi:quinol monooxygenase YgiN